MESEFLHWLDGFPLHLGTVLSIILGAVGISSAIITGIIKVKHDYETRITEIALQEETERKFKEDIQKMMTEVTLLKENTEFLSTQYATTTRELKDKIDRISNIVTETREVSDNRDNIIEEQLKRYNNNLYEFRQEIQTNKDQLSLLIDSDKQSIRSFIVDKYYQVMNDGYINTHLLEVLEERYEKYLKENGNGYVKALMEEIRDLPHTPSVD